MISTIASVVGPFTAVLPITPILNYQPTKYNETYSNPFHSPINPNNITTHDTSGSYIPLKDQFDNLNILQNESYNPTAFTIPDDAANTTLSQLARAIAVTNSTGDSSNSSDTENPQIPAYIRTTSMVFCIIIMCLGVVGNIMVPIVIMKTKDMRNSTNIFLMNLSIADLMVLLVCTPTVLVEVNTRPETWVLGKEMCLAVPFVELTVAHASVLTILAISFERYYAICEPLKAGYVCTKTRAALICFLAWFVAAVFTSPILGVASYQFEEYFDGSVVPVCLTQADTFWPALYFITTISIFFIIPLAILIILYTIIAKNLMENPGIITQNNKHNNVSGNSVLRYRKQVVMMLGTVVLSFFICLLPFRALTLWIIIVPPETLTALGVDGYYILLYFCRIMLYLNSAVNPILYNLMSSKFRDGFLRLLRLNKFKKLQRFHKGDNIQRKDTFNTTTSTNYSSSQHTTDSFWRRYSNRNASQKSPQKVVAIVNGSVKKTAKNGSDRPRKSSKVGEIIGVQNNRRNSMRFVSDVILLPKEGRNDSTACNANLQSYLEKGYEIKTDTSADVIVECVDERTSLDLSRNDGETSDKSLIYSKDAIVIEGLGSGEKKTHFVRVPLLISKNSSAVSKGCVSQFSKESFV